MAKAYPSCLLQGDQIVMASRVFSKACIWLCLFGTNKRTKRWLMMFANFQAHSVPNAGVRSDHNFTTTPCVQCRDDGDLMKTTWLIAVQLSRRMKMKDSSEMFPRSRQWHSLPYKPKSITEIAKDGAGDRQNITTSKMLRISMSNWPLQCTSPKRP